MKQLVGVVDRNCFHLVFPLAAEPSWGHVAGFNRIGRIVGDGFVRILEAPLELIMPVRL